MDEKIRELLRGRFGIYSENALFTEAFVHKFDDKSANNLRLAFLGDRVISLAIRQHYFQKIQGDTGELTKICADMESRSYLAEKAREFGIDKMLTGRNKPEKEGEDKAFTHAIEALFGVIYLDQGLQTARNLVEKHIIDEPLLAKLRAEGRIKPNTPG